MKHIKTALIAILLFNIAGTLAELVLLEHTEDIWQQVPVFLLAFSSAVIIWVLFRENKWSLKFLQWSMILFIISGLTGIWLHYSGNVEFEREIYPDLSGWALFMEAIKGATPVLAPGTMTGLGLLGYVCSKIRSSSLETKT